MTNSGRLFHVRGPATAKTRSPSDERCVAVTTIVHSYKHTHVSSSYRCTPYCTSYLFCVSGIFSPVCFMSSVPVQVIKSEMTDYMSSGA